MTAGEGAVGATLGAGRSVATPDAPPAFVELQIEGMTCASCANRVERKLNKLENVTAEVNYATEKARVEFGPGIETQLLLDTVSKAGYSATPRHQPAAGRPRL